MRPELINRILYEYRSLFMWIGVGILAFILLMAVSRMSGFNQQAVPSGTPYVNPYSVGE